LVDVPVSPHATEPIGAIREPTVRRAGQDEIDPADSPLRREA